MSKFGYILELIEKTADKIEPYLSPYRLSQVRWFGIHLSDLGGKFYERMIADAEAKDDFEKAQYWLDAFRERVGDLDPKISYYDAFLHFLKPDSGPPGYDWTDPAEHKPIPPEGKSSVYVLGIHGLADKLFPDVYHYRPGFGWNRPGFGWDYNGYHTPPYRWRYLFDIPESRKDLK